MSPSDESRVRNHTKSTNYPTNTITMVLEPLALPVAWIWWFRAARGVGSLAKYFLRPPVKDFVWLIKLIHVSLKSGWPAGNNGGKTSTHCRWWKPITSQWHINEQFCSWPLVSINYNYVIWLRLVEWKRWQRRTNVPWLWAILMATRRHWSDMEGIAWCSMTRATPEATGRCHRATNHSISPQRPPGQQQQKHWCEMYPFYWPFWWPWWCTGPIPRFMAFLKAT